MEKLIKSILIISTVFTMLFIDKCYGICVSLPIIFDFVLSPYALFINKDNDAIFFTLAIIAIPFYIFLKTRIIELIILVLFTFCLWSGIYLEFHTNVYLDDCKILILGNIVLFAYTLFRKKNKLSSTQELDKKLD